MTMSGSTPNIELEQPLHVAVGVIRNPEREVLIAQRHKQLHQGGLWEFPGGKLEQGESVQEALARELFEELGIRVNEASPLITIHHSYADIKVFLDVWVVESFSGIPYGKENQSICWVSPENLKRYEFPVANRAIRLAIELPETLAILNVQEDEKRSEVMKRLTSILERGCKLVQLRGKALAENSYCSLAQTVAEMCKKQSAKLLLNAGPGLVQACGAEGVHLSSSRLLALRSRPLSENFLVSASCHNREELEHAADLGLDFVVVSPVMKTVSHPGAEPLGWQAFERLVSYARLPVYGLGGLGFEELGRAKCLGAQGIAGISLLYGKQVRRAG